MTIYFYIFIIFIKILGALLLNNKINFTKREKDVIELLKFGYSNPEIAERLYISQHSIKVYIANLLVKTNSKNRTNLIYNLAKNDYFKQS